MTRIVADTTSGIPPELARELGIPLLPQIINFGDTSYREGVDLDHASFITRLRADRELPKTAAPFPGDFVNVFQELARDGDSIVCIHPSAEVSGTVRSAHTARDSFPDADIRIIDTRSIVGPLATMVLAADQLAKAGGSADQIEALVHDLMARARIYFLVDTLEFLQRGGRIGGASALIGSILQIKPILTFSAGRIEPFEKERTRNRALARLQAITLEQAARGEETHLSIMHAGAPADAARLADTLKAALGTPDVLIMALAQSVITHAGPGALAVGFFAPRAPRPGSAGSD